MQPIQLKFRGINSYREEQTLDFSPMGKAAVFGIFGPTGAGKSTILDAITLALYGEVTRSKNKAQGVINQQEKQAAVSFIFRLGEYTYQVERTLVREKGKEFSARVKSCRLLRLEDQVVLASDKTDEVTKGVVQLIGLKSDDFLRSVALPQGQFDRFLRLGAAERGKMLEHLFGLERYGAELQEKIKTYQELLQQKAETIAFRLEQMGDCSPKRRKAEREALAALQAEMEAAKTRWQQCNAAWQNWQALAAKQKELETAKVQQQRLQQEEAAVAAARQEWETAQKLEPLRPQMEQAQADHQGLKQLEATLRQQKEAFHRQQAELSQQLALQQQCQELRSTVYDGWLLRIQELEQEKANLTQAEALRKQLTDAQQQMEILQQQQHHWQQQKTAWQQKQADWQQRQQQCLAALQQQREILQQKQDWQAGNALWQSWQEQRRHQQELMKQKEEWQRQQQAVLAQLCQLAETPGASNLAARQGLQRAYEEAQQHYAAAKRQQEQLGAAQLAQGLQEGTPCPVCGSVHHPHLAVATGETPDLAAAEEAYNLWLGRWKQGETLGERQEEIGRRLAALAAEEAAQTPAWQEAEQAWQRWLADRPADYLTELERELQKAETASQGLEETKGRLEQEEAVLQQQRQELQQEELTLTRQLTTAENQTTHLQAQLKALGAVRSLEAVLAELAAVQQKKDHLLQQEAAVQQRLAVLQPQTAAAEKQYNESLGRQTALQQHLDTLKATLQKACAALGYAMVNEAKGALRSEAQQRALQETIQNHVQQQFALQTKMQGLTAQLQEAEFRPEAGQEYQEALREAELQQETAIGRLAQQQNLVAELERLFPAWQTWQRQQSWLQKQQQEVKELLQLTKGGAFVNFLAEEYLGQVLLGANQYLARFSNGRFTLELRQMSQTAGQEFFLRDAYNAGQLRPINTMSGGEIFLAALALALALSTQIQLHGKYELGFFFLDEGFGTLDAEKLDTLMNAVEKLPENGRLVGIITHVQEVKNRLPYYWEITPASISSGSKVRWGAN